jgi:hypothetical protein
MRLWWLQPSSDASGICPTRDIAELPYLSELTLPHLGIPSKPLFSPFSHRCRPVKHTLQSVMPPHEIFHDHHARLFI